MDRIDGAFDEASHTVDVRTDRRRTRAGTTSTTSASSSGGCRATGSRACRPARRAAVALSLQPARQPRAAVQPLRAARATRRGLATELHVPAPIRRAFFGLDLSLHQGPPPPDFTSLYGLPSDPGLAAPPILSDDASLFVIVDQTARAPRERALPPARRLAGDASHGRRDLDRRRERTARPRHGLRRDEAGATCS